MNTGFGPVSAGSGRGGATGDLATQLSELARDLRRQPDVDSTLTGIVHAALSLIPAATAASVSLVRARRRVESRAASGELPRIIDALQTETGQGPCLDAVFKQRIVRVPNVRDDPRWPDLAQRAWDAGARSMLSFQLSVDRDNLGALNLYGSEVGEFGEECEQVGLLVAAHAAIALADAQEISNLTAALVNRDVIGQAKGILMERHKLTAHEAFLVLSSASTTTNTRLIEVAEQLAARGDLAVRHRQGRQPPPAHP
ncbi:GAF and ANTAR domain-containing protein [Arthrobacter agilis]|uniref:GAF and ANTAR domain-containing protein n=1 Tax=Arthrobacter agilis TaxID=37921 RepID=UPI0027849CDC|nr:GAF and ANTAR domain-containing protein [Arthrobacter agilis]MDQ0736101.1 GAF domain-containing protein [Arthrobacter agilis]